MANELPQIEQSLQDNVSKAVEGGMPLDTPLYGARGETLKDMVEIKQPTTPAPDDPILFEGKEVAPSVDVFLGADEFTVDDILSDDMAVSPFADIRKTNKVTSAKMAALEDEKKALSVYGENVDAISNGDLTGLESSLSRLEQQSYEQSGSALVQLLQDPEVSEEDKAKAINDYHSYKLTDFSLNKAVMTESLIADDEGENPQQENVRINTIAAIDSVNESKRQMQALLNMEAAKSDIRLGKAFKDLFVFMTPYMETSFFTQLGVKTNEDLIDAIGNIGFLGEGKTKLREMITALPPEKRIEMAQKLVEVIDSTPGALPFEQNDYARLEALRVVAEDGYYGDFERYLDDAISMLDLTFFGGFLARTSKGVTRLVKGGKTAISVARDAKRLAVRTNVDQTSLSQLYKDTNVSKAKAAHEAVIADETGEVAEAVYGTNRVEAVANDQLPEIAGDGVRNKVGEPDSTYTQAQTPSPELVDIVEADSKMYYWQAEKERMRAKVVNDMEAAVGVRNRKEMNQIERTDNGVRIKAVYGTPQFGYETAQEALDTVKVAMRGQGITEDELTLLGRFGDEYRPVKITDLKALDEIEKTGVKVDKPQDFLVQVDYDYKFNPLDNAKWEEADVRLNFLDRMPLFAGKKQGSLTRMAFDAASIIHPKLKGAASVAEKRGAAIERSLLTRAKEYSDALTKLPGERIDKVTDYFKEANERGIAFSKADLKARGFFDDEIEVVRKWRTYWDDMWWLNNRDYRQSLDAKGYNWFIDSNNDTKVLARPIARNQTGKQVRVYDQTTGKVKELKEADIAKLYDAGGSLARMRTPMQVGDESIDVVAATNQAGSSYLRRLNKNDAVLNYRDGYYTRRYTAPKYIDKIVKDNRGNVMYRQAVAVSGDSLEANTMANNLRKTNPTYEYEVRSDIRAEGADSFDDEFDVLQSYGMTPQRTRGKLLETSTMKNNFGDNYVMGPTDSMILSARAVSNRVSMRDFIETTKMRFMNQFADVLPKDKFGRPSYPANIDHLGKPGEKYSGKVRDARSTYEWINYLEHGYINGLDEGLKTVLNGASELLGEMAVKYDSKVLAAAQRAALKGTQGRGPTAFLKNTVFNIFLATNPIRQFIVQSHQAAQLLAFNPTYMPKIMNDMSLLVSHKLGAIPDDDVLMSFGRTRKEYNEMVEAWERSGMSAAVDKNTLINGSLNDLMEERRIKGKTGPIGKTFNFSRRIGFDAGEHVNQMTAWLAFYDKYKRMGKWKGKELEDRVISGATNFTYDMTRSGDMPYNQNFLGLVFQFMQVPHKAMMTWTTNRALPWSEKSKLLLFNTTMYSLPPAAMLSWFGESGADILPEDPLARDAMIQGMESLMLNKLLTMASGEKTEIDFSGLSPFDIHGMAEFMTGIWTSDITEMFANSPAGSVLVGNNPRITDAARQWAKMFSSPMEKGIQNPEAWMNVAKSSLSIFSGFSNAFKAQYALETRRKMSGAGNVTDEHVSQMEAWFAAAGFGTIDEAEARWISNEQYKKSKDMRDDVKKYVQNLARDLAREGISKAEQEFVIETYRRAWAHFGNDNLEARKIVMEELKKQVANKNDTLFKRALEIANWKDSAGVKDMIRQMPELDADRKKRALEVVDYMRDFKGE